MRQQVMSAFETFLTKDPDYLRHRRIWLSSLKGGRKIAHYKRPDSTVIALACIAWDWRASGRKFMSLAPWLQKHKIFSQLNLRTRQRWKNHFTAMRKLLSRSRIHRLRNKHHRKTDRTFDQFIRAKIVAALVRLNSAADGKPPFPHWLNTPAPARWPAPRTSPRPRTCGPRSWRRRGSR